MKFEPYKAISTVLVIGLVGTSVAAVYYYRQQGMAQQTVLQDANLQDSYKGHIADLTSQLSNLSNQIDALNSQIDRLQALNSQLGSNNSQLISQIQQLQSQASQLQSELSQVQRQITDLTEKLSLQKSRVIATQTILYRDSFTNLVHLVNLGQIQYSGYLRVSWVSQSPFSFNVQVFDANVTTPVATTGVYNVPVTSSNATSNAFFRCFEYYFVNGAYVCTGSDSGVMTFSLTYWY